MTKTTIVTLTLTSLLLLGSVGPSFAWSKNFQGTRAQVVNACKGPGMVLNNGSTNSTCHNLNNGTHVDCNDAGNCEGGGTGPNPTRLVEANTIRGTVVGAATATAGDPAALTGSIVETILKWKLKGKKKAAEEPMEGPSPNASGGGSLPDSGPAADAGAPAGGGAPEGGIGMIGQWHASGAGTIL
jgi:hypothetical protein